MIRVRGYAGEELVLDLPVGHGEDPDDLLAANGWAGRTARVEGVHPDLVLVADVHPVQTRPLTSRAVGEGLTRSERSRVTPVQRIAAYAVVVATPGLLLTQLSPRTGAPGLWNLPGGGIDPGESPTAAVVREVHEETGQVVTEVALLGVQSRHWVGTSRRGVEDYHALRIFHTASCRSPSDPVVHDVGGSTSQARWVALSDLLDWPLATGIPEVLTAAGVTPAGR